MSLLLQFVVLFISCVARATKGKFDHQLAELVAVTFLTGLCLYIEAVKTLVRLAYASYGAGRTLRRWWDDFTVSPAPAVNPAPPAGPPPGGGK
jgi:hypothetical protein